MLGDRWNGTRGIFGPISAPEVRATSGWSVTGPQLMNTVRLVATNAQKCRTVVPRHSIGGNATLPRDGKFQK